MGIGCQQLLVLPLDTRAWMQVEPALEMVQAVRLHREGWCFLVSIRRAMKMAEE